MSISITIHAESGAEARQQMRELLGEDVPVYSTTLAEIAPEIAAEMRADIAARSVQNDARREPTIADVRMVPNAPRERGKPSPGHARRTKAEIAEDEAAALGAALDAGVIHVNGQTEESALGISTGDERVGPEDDAATVEQDEADEAAETAAAVEERPADKKLTHDDVRNSLGAYVKLYGMAAAQEDGPKVIALALKNPEIVKVSAIPETREALGAVVAGIDEMTDKNPFKRAKVA